MHLILYNYNTFTWFICSTRWNSCQGSDGAHKPHRQSPKKNINECTSLSLRTQLPRNIHAYIPYALCTNFGAYKREFTLFNTFLSTTCRHFNALTLSKLNGFNKTTREVLKDLSFTVPSERPSSSVMRVQIKMVSTVCAHAAFNASFTSQPQSSKRGHKHRHTYALLQLDLIDMQMYLLMNCFRIFSVFSEEIVIDSS